MAFTGDDLRKTLGGAGRGYAEIGIIDRAAGATPAEADQVAIYDVSSGLETRVSLAEANRHPREHFVTLLAVSPGVTI